MDRQSDNLRARSECWGPDSLRSPCDEGWDVYDGREGLDVSSEASGDAARAFEAAKDAFDNVSLTVDGPVMVDLDLALGFR
jgi:hypothetical protein